MYAEYQRLMAPWMKHDAPPPAVNVVQHNHLFETIDREMAKVHAKSQCNLASELLARIHANEPVFFEDLVIDVMLAMGYGGRRRDLAKRLGRSGDGGIDGLISMDELGLDQVYLQAKRLKPGTAVPVSEVRDFAGSLDAHHAAKGIFVSTGHFSPAAASFCKQVSRRMVLVDGTKFAEMMIRYNVGVRVKQSYQIKRVDLEYFRKELHPEQVPR
jgi:restriction system protein